MIRDARGTMPTKRERPVREPESDVQLSAQRSEIKKKSQTRRSQAASPTHVLTGAALQERARIVGEVLDQLYPDPPIPLEHSDPFTMLVATVLSAQTTDKRVNMVTPKLFTRAPTPQALAAMSESEILEIIREVGIAPTKSKRLKAMAQQLCDRYGGQVPNTFEALEALPGVGHKTASVVMVQSFGEPAFPVDTHIHRLAKRFGLSEGKTVEQVEADLKRLFPRDSWGKRHLQFIYFGREYCTALRHDPAQCPICRFCQ